MLACEPPGKGEHSAEHAGIRIDDVIVSINDTHVRDSGSLRNAVGLLRPGDKVRVGLIREGKETSVTATLGASTAANAKAEPEPEKVSVIEELGSPVAVPVELTGPTETRSSDRSQASAATGSPAQRTRSTRTPRRSSDPSV